MLFIKLKSRWKLLVLILAFLSFANVSNATDLDTNYQNCVVEFKIQSERISADSIFSIMDQFQLPELKLEVIDSHSLKVAFWPYFDSLALNNLEGLVKIDFEEHYGFDELKDALCPMMGALATFGDDKTKYFASTCLSEMKEQYERQTNFSSSLGTFAVADTADVNDLLEVFVPNKQQERVTFFWNLMEDRNRVELHLGVKETVPIELSVANMMTLYTHIRQVTMPDDWDDNYQPISWATNPSYEIGIKFDKNGTELFKELTQRLLKKHLSITVNGVIFSSPMIFEAILDGAVNISGTKASFIQTFYWSLFQSHFDNSFRMIDFEIKPVG